MTFQSCAVASLSTGHTIHGPPDLPNRKLGLYFFSLTTFCLMLPECEILVFPCINDLSAIIFMNQKIETCYELRGSKHRIVTVSDCFRNISPSEHYPQILLKSDISCSPAICAFCMSLYYGTHLLFWLPFNSFWRWGIMSTHWGPLVSRTQWALRNAEGIDMKTSVIIIYWYDECMDNNNCNPYDQNGVS